MCPTRARTNRHVGELTRAEATRRLAQFVVWEREARSYLLTGTLKMALIIRSDIDIGVSTTRESSNALIVAGA
jgi:hypothetical protein